MATYVNTIESFLSGKPKLIPATACSSTYASKPVQTAAGKIGDWIDAHHCSE